ncbi:MAG: hypothetical protein ACTSRG_24390, partial [Candidatus Helarchaeota archaeon]
MNSKFLDILKNFSYTFISTLISLLVSTIVILVVPKLIGVEDYGYWQLYLFYASYVGFMHFGWNDGIYLRYGGKNYNSLNKKLFFSQFYMLTITQLIIAIIIVALTFYFTTNSNRIFIFLMVAICMVITNVRWMLIYILQATYRIKEYARINIIGRILYVSIIIVFLLFGIREYKLMIIADIIGRFISLSYAAYLCEDIVFRKISTLFFSLKETFENITVGVKLMFANIASMLIIGVIRFGIERSWDVSTFGKVSLTLSASNLLMLFINTVGIIVYPILRRTKQNNLPTIYITMRDFLMVFLLGILIIYYPFKETLFYWLPKYADSLKFMALLLPICVYEGKMALLINTYLKSLRKESLMLKINLTSLFVSVISTIFLSVIFKNLNLLIVSIVFLLGLRCILAEILLSKFLKISIHKDIYLELIMTILFISTGWFINSWKTVAIYGTGYVLYLLI